MATTIESQVCQVIDQEIDSLKRLRNHLVRILADGQADGWRASDVGLHGLLQFHRIDDIDLVDAKVIAKALSDEWDRRRDGSWEGRLRDFREWTAILHSAEPPDAKSLIDFSKEDAA